LQLQPCDRVDVGSSAARRMVADATRAAVGLLLLRGW
jgi:hypothetical protein